MNCSAPLSAHCAPPVSGQLILPSGLNPYPGSQNLLNSLTNSNVVTVSLPPSCSFCTDKIISNLSRSIYQVPVQVYLTTGIPLPESSCNTFGSINKRIPLENELLQQTVPSYLYPYKIFPPSQNQKPKRRLDEYRKFSTGIGPTKWLLKRKTSKQVACTISKNKLVRTQLVLKRLQNNRMRCIRRMERRRNAEELESIRESRFKILRLKGIKGPRKTECVLWNCPRKEYKRKRPFIPVDLTARSASRLSILSRKSRSPIVFHRAP